MGYWLEPLTGWACLFFWEVACALRSHVNTTTFDRKYVGAQEKALK
jgi:hypothetical protein